MTHRYIVVLTVTLICAVFVPQSSTHAQRNNFYLQQQQMRNQQMMQQQRQMQRQQQEMARRQAEMQRRQAEMRRQQQAMRERQRQAQQQRQRQAQIQRQRMAERQRAMQQKRQRKLKEQQTKSQRQQIARQQKALQQQQALRQQRKMKDRQKRLQKLQNERLRKRKTDKKKQATRDMTMAMLLARLKPNLDSLRTKQGLSSRPQTVRQFQQKRLQQQKRQRATKQLANVRRLAKAQLQKFSLLKKRLQTKRVKDAQRQEKKKTAQKSAQNAFAACKNGLCGTNKCSFHGDTLVLTLDGYKPIKRLAAGQDLVWSRDEYTGETNWKAVAAHYSNYYDETVEVTIRNHGSRSEQTIRSNRIHPFFVRGLDARSPIRQLLTSSAQALPFDNVQGTWIEADDLKAGDRLLESDGEWSQVTQVVVRSVPIQAYNLTVADYHTYFVKGATRDNTDPVWVHNKCEEIDPRQIRFSQFSASKNMALYGTVNDLAKGLQNGKISKESIKPIRVVERNGKLYTLDHRRLLAFQLAGMKSIRVQRVSLKDPKIARLFKERFNPVDDGKRIVVLKNRAQKERAEEELRKAGKIR